MKAIAFAAILAASTQAALADCRQHLVLALDVSGSVDELEYDLQINGLADALTDQAVIDAILSTPQYPVVLSAFEWSSQSYQRIILSPTAIENRRDLNLVTQTFKSLKRRVAPTETALGSAMGFASEILNAGPNCLQRTIDISADGKNNSGPEPASVKRSQRLSGTIVNALVIGNELDRPAGSEAGGIAELSAYFSTSVIHGPNAFIETALGYSDYGDAMRRKLLRELATLKLSARQ